MANYGKEPRRDTEHASTPERVAAPTPGKHTLVEQLPGPSVQRHGSGAVDDAAVHGAAARGVATPASPLPHAGQIQHLFGRHDISAVQAHTDPAAAASARAMGADAYATGDHVVLGDRTDLHTAAHEAAHVVQQRGGVQLKGGVGQAGDAHEQHADAVADLVVQGKSAEALLSTYAPGGGAATSTGAVQRKWGGDLREEETDGEMLEQLKQAYPDHTMPPVWKIKQLRESPTVYKSLEEVKAALKLAAKPSAGPQTSASRPEPTTSSTPDTSKPPVQPPPVPRHTKPQLPSISKPQPEPKLDVEPPVETTPSVTAQSHDSQSQDKGKQREQPESHDSEPQYKIVKQLGDGSHHAAYELEESGKPSEWIFLVNKVGPIEDTVRKRQAAYSKFPDSIVAKMGDVITAYQGKTPMKGVLLEKMSGDMFHSTNQAWLTGLRKTVMRWKDADTTPGKSECAAKIKKTMQGMDTFIGAGQIVDDFQYWITEDGSFKLSDVKSAQLGDVEKIHAELVNCRKKIEVVLNSL